MSKNKAKRRPAQEVVESFTREDVQASIVELETLNAGLDKIARIIKAMIDSNMDESDIEGVRSLVAVGAFKRRSYLEAKIRRVALALLRAKGRKSWIEYIQDNEAAIPTVEDKAARTSFMQNISQ